MKKTTKFLLIILLLAAFLRVFNVNDFRNILNRDEAALAYNGYLLSELGMDEWGKKYPIILQSFGDYKLPVYPYTLALLFKFLPKNDFVVKLPSIISGVFLSYLAFLYARSLKVKNDLALYLAFLITITPIFLFFSRIAFEANVALLIFLSAIYLLFFKESSKNIRFKFDTIASILILVSVFTYNTPFLLLPFVILALILFREFKKPKTYIPTVIMLLIVFGISALIFVPLSSQKSAITIFSDETVWSEFVNFRQNYSGLTQRIIANRYLYNLSIVSKNFFSSFDPSFIVFRGGKHPWHSLNGFGHLYLSTYLLSLIGISSSLIKLLKNLKKKQVDKKILVLFYFLVFSLFPAVITTDAPHATRSLSFFFFLCLFAVLGLKKLSVKKHFFSIIIVISIIESGNYLNSYFNSYLDGVELNFGSNFRNSVSELESSDKDKNIAIIDMEGYQYILLAWYAKISPQVYLETNIRQLPDAIGFRYGEQVDNYHFIVNPNDRREDEDILLQQENNRWTIERM